MEEAEKERIHRIRLDIEADRMVNNKFFMDWWEATMCCQNCSQFAKRYQSLIRKRDRAVSNHSEEIGE